MISDFSKNDQVRNIHQFRILLIEDSPTDALLVQLHIEKSSEFSLQIVATLSQALECLNSQDLDLVLLDLNLPDAYGLEGLIKLRHHSQKLPIVVLTGVDDEELGIMALQRGAQDYLVKNVDNSRLMKAIRYAIERMLVNDSENSINRINQRTRLMSTMYGTEKPKQHEILTERELQVLKLLGKGSSNQEIAERLLVSVNTIKTHIAHILHKLAVSDRTKAIIEAQQLGLI